MQNILITGFTPFDGREVNASWVAASSSNREGINALEIPVVWGKPMRVLQSFCDNQCPQMIISLGEGREGWFDIETIALNTRNERVDNEGKLPAGEPIIPGAPDSISASINAGVLQRGLARHGYPIRISNNAGQFLCEETLFVLEHLRNRYQSLEKVLFCHLPPFGTSVHIRGESRTCDQSVLEDFTQALLRLSESPPDPSMPLEAARYQTPVVERPL
jgi:pyroglutamyl-peptidase